MKARQALRTAAADGSPGNDSPPPCEACLVPACES
jgi:hypothetical protein